MSRRPQPAAASLFATDAVQRGAGAWLLSGAAGWGLRSRRPQPTAMSPAIAADMSQRPCVRVVAGLIAFIWVYPYDSRQLCINRVDFGYF